MIVLVNKGILLFQLFLCKVRMSSSISFLEVCADFLESLSASLLLKSLLHHVVSLLVALSLNLLLQFVVINLMTVFALHVSSEFLHQLLLHYTHRLDSLVSSLQGIEKVNFLNLVHLTFHHHDVILCSTYHQVHVGISHLCLRRINYEFTADTCHANLRNRTLERNI